VISATLDTSVYIRALHFGGPATLILGHARAGSIRIDISDAIVDETNRVLRDKFQWGGYSLQDAREKLRALGNHVSRLKPYSSSKKIPTTTASSNALRAPNLTSSSAKTRTCYGWGNSAIPKSYRSGISSTLPSRRVRRRNPNSLSASEPGVCIRAAPASHLNARP
jgi:hypothetical protein